MYIFFQNAPLEIFVFPLLFEETHHGTSIRPFHVPVCIQNLCTFAAVLKGVPSEAEIRPVEPDADNAAVGR